MKHLQVYENFEKALALVRRMTEVDQQKYVLQNQAQQESQAYQKFIETIFLNVAHPDPNNPNYYYIKLAYDVPNSAVKIRYLLTENMNNYRGAKFKGSMLFVSWEDVNKKGEPDRRTEQLNNLPLIVLAATHDALLAAYPAEAEGGEMGFYVKEGKTTVTQIVKAHHDLCTRIKAVVEAAGGELALDIPVDFVFGSEAWGLEPVHLTRARISHGVVIFNDFDNPTQSLPKQPRKVAHQVWTYITTHYPDLTEASEMGFFVREN